MNNKQHGTIEQISSFSWKVEIPSTLTLPNSMQQWTSSCFSCLKSFHNFCMAISWTGNKTLSGKLYVFEEIKGVPDTHDFLIALKYKHKKEIFIKENVKPVKNKEWFQYELETVNIDNLLKITCAIFNRDAPSGAIFGSEADNASNETSDDDDDDNDDYYDDDDDNDDYYDDDNNDDYYDDDNNDETIEGDIFYDKGKQENRNKKKNFEKERYEEEKVNEIENKEERSRVSGENALSEDLKSLFLDEEESDIILKVGGQKYPAHKMIIRARSPVFYAMLKHDMKEKKEGAVDIEDCDPHIFREFLYYLYSGKLEKLTDDNVFELHHISDKYDVKLLRMECVDFIRTHLDVGTICDAISLASKHCQNDLLTYATKFFIDNVHDILTTVKWQKFVKENPVEATELFIKTVNQKIPKKET